MNSNILTPADNIYNEHVFSGGKVYYFGGILGGATAVNTAYCLDVSTPGSKWKALSAMPASRFGGTASAVGGKIYLIGGLTVSGTTSSLAMSVIEYDPVANTYATKSQIPAGVAYATSVVMNNKILILGGSSTGGYAGAVNSNQVYDPATDSWDVLNSMNTSTYHASVAVVGKTIYCIGGINTAGQIISTVQKGTMGTSNILWSTAAQMPIGGFDGSAGTINGNIILTCGTQDGQNPISTTYKYDVVANKWSKTYNFPFATQQAGPLVGDSTTLYFFNGAANMGTYKFTEGTPVAIASVNADPIVDYQKVGDMHAKMVNIGNIGVIPLSVDIATPAADTWLSTNLLSTSIQAGDVLSLEVDLSSDSLKEGTYSSTITITTNDETHKTIVIPVKLYVANNVAQHVNLFEMYTSSTCPPCNPGNAKLTEVLTNYDETSYALVKFQQDFPSTGDPYATVETISRRGYYNINGIPSLHMDGGADVYAPNMTTADVDPIQAQITLMTISATHSVDPVTHLVNVDVNMGALADYPSANNRLYVAICEKTTTKNKKTNGETSFEHVVKKMMPNETGTLVGSITKGTPITKSFSYTFPGKYRLPLDGQATHYINLATENTVENFNNLEVVVWVQDSKSHQVLNSAHSVESAKNVEIDVTDATALQLGDSYPNPATNESHMQYFVPNSGRCTIDLVDITGNTVRTLFEGYQVAGAHNVFIDSDNLSSGLYQVVLKSNTKSIAKSFVVAH